MSTTLKMAIPIQCCNAWKFAIINLKFIFDMKMKKSKRI